MAKDAFSFRHITPQQTCKAILGMKSLRVEIPTNVLQILANEIYVSLTDSINCSILNENFPNELKIVDVLLFFLNDPFDKYNYRIINLFPSLSNVYEKLIYHQLNFFSRYGSQHALLNLLNKWQSCLGKSGVISAVFMMALSKAFDCLLHNLISVKLHAYGLNSGSLKVSESYLSNRYQRTLVDNALSSWLKVLLVVPQGSFLSPFWFNIFALFNQGKVNLQFC